MGNTFSWNQLPRCKAASLYFEPKHSVTAIIHNKIVRKLIITLVESIIYNETGDVIYIKFVLTYNSEILTFHGLMTPHALL